MKLPLVTPAKAGIHDFLKDPARPSLAPRTVRVKATRSAGSAF